MFIDSNVFIYSIVDSRIQGRNSKKFIQRIIDGEQKAVVSVAVIDEVVFAIYSMRNYDLNSASKTWKKLNSIPNLKILDINREVSETVPEFIKQGLDPTDAVHAATMKVYKIKTICSYDKHFDDIKGINRQEPR